MKKEGISKESLKVMMKKFKNHGAWEIDHFEYNTKIGCVLAAQRKFLKTPTEMLLAKCAYCQSIEHATTKCHDICCPLHDYMCKQKRYTR